MKQAPVYGIVGRMVTAFILSAVFLYMVPSLAYTPTIPFVSLFSEWFCPYISDVSVSVEGLAVMIKGVITLNMTTIDGSQIPPAPATWNYSNKMLMNVTILAVAVWAAPVCRFRTRMIAFPITILAAVLTCSYLLAFDVQETALRFIGEEWLITQSIEPTQANIDYFEKIQSKYLTVKWVESIHDGGGIYFLGVLSGLIGYALPGCFRKTGKKEASCGEAS